MKTFPVSAPHSIGFSFGTPYPPNFGSLAGQPHLGVDILGVGKTALPIGTPLVAVADAVVERIAVDNGKLQGGNELFFRTTDGILHWYFHLSQFQCKVGDKVKMGQVIALSGNSGTATTAPHLHWGCGKKFSTHIKDLIDPLVWVQGEPMVTSSNANGVLKALDGKDDHGVDSAELANALNVGDQIKVNTIIAKYKGSSDLAEQKLKLLKDSIGNLKQFLNE